MTIKCYPILFITHKKKAIIIIIIITIYCKYYSILFHTAESTCIEMLKWWNSYVLSSDAPSIENGEDKMAAIMERHAATQIPKVTRTPTDSKQKAALLARFAEVSDGEEYPLWNILCVCDSISLQSNWFYLDEWMTGFLLQVAVNLYSCKVNIRCLLEWCRLKVKPIILA